MEPRGDGCQVSPKFPPQLQLTNQAEILAPNKVKGTVDTFFFFFIGQIEKNSMSVSVLDT